MAALLFGMLLSSCGGDASGCSNFPAKSRPVDVGDSVEYEVEVANDHWGTVDVAGGFWASHGAKPLPQLADGTYDAIATRTGEGTLVIAIPGQDPVEFVGPLSCE